MNRRSFLKGTAASLAMTAAAGQATAALADDGASWQRRVLADPQREIARLTREAEGGRPWFAPLTPNEGYLAELIAAGLTNVQIAARFGISRRTTDVAVYRVFTKLDVHKRKSVTEWVANHRPRWNVRPTV